MSARYVRKYCDIARGAMVVIHVPEQSEWRTAIASRVQRGVVTEVRLSGSGEIAALTYGADCALVPKVPDDVTVPPEFGSFVAAQEFFLPYLSAAEAALAEAEGNARPLFVEVDAPASVSGWSGTSYALDAATETAKGGATVNDLCECGHYGHEHERCDFPESTSCTVCACRDFTEATS